MTRPVLRPARAAEVRLLAELSSAASSGVEDYIWEALRPPDRPEVSVLDVGAQCLAMTGVAWGFEHAEMLEADGAVAGMVHHFVLEADDDPSDDPVFNAFGALEAQAVGHWYVSNMIVTEDFRGRGFGRRLLDHAVARGQDAGCPATSLLVFAGNAPAVSLYESAGFRRAGVNPVPESPLIYGKGDLVIMTRPNP